MRSTASSVCIYPSGASQETLRSHDAADSKRHPSKAQRTLLFGAEGLTRACDTIHKVRPVEGRFVLVCGLAVASLVLGGCGGAATSGQPAGPVIAVTGTDGMRYNPDTISVKAG